MPSPTSDLFGFASPSRCAVSVRNKKAEEAVEPQQEAPPINKDSITLGTRDSSWITDAIAVTQFAGSGFLYKEAAKEAAAEQEQVPPLSDAPVVKLEDPFLIAPGWTTRPEKFDNMVAHLLKNPENGERALYLNEGKAYTDRECTQETSVSASDKVFVAVYDNVLSPPDKTAPQLDAAVELIKSVQGPKVDVLGYSMGGIAVRKMLDNQSEEVDQVAFLGSSHQGTRFASLAKYVVQRDIKFAMKMANIDSTHLPAMGWMMPVDESRPGNSPKLEELNANLPRQQAQATEMVNIGSDGFATITKPWGGSEGGDGLVHASSLELPGVPTVIVKGRGNKQHGNLPSDTDTFRELADYFNWQTV